MFDMLLKFKKSKLPVHIDGLTLEAQKSNINIEQLHFGLNTG